MKYVSEPMEAVSLSRARERGRERGFFDGGPRVLVAPNAYKGSLSKDVAIVIAAGIREAGAPPSSFPSLTAGTERWTFSVNLSG